MYTEPFDPLGHTEVVDAAVDAACTITGLTEGKHCSVCDEILVAQTTIPELGHQYGEASCDVPATCSECGETTGEALGHADENRDHKCDRSCGKADMGEHVDENQDHDCDYGCQQSIGTHADSADDADHVCDYGCGAEGGFFSADAAVTAVAEGSKVTFTAEAVLNGTTYTNRRVIEVEKMADGTFTLKLPEKKTDLLVMIAGYEENGRMTGSMMLGGVGVTMEQETVFSMNGDALKVFLLDAKTCAPVMPNLMLQIAE